MKKKFRALKHYLFPHRHNRYKPGIFNRESVAAIVLIMLVLEGVYLFQVNVVLQNTGFLASVLPAALTDLTNSDRAAQGIASLAEDPLLDQAAQMKANDMAAKGYFAHISPDGKTPWYWLDQMKYPYTYAGENLAVDFTDSKDVENAWMNSPTHRANILKAQYTNVGIGVAQGMYQGKSTTFVVQVFATRSDSGIKVAATAVPTKREAVVPADQLATTQRESGNVLGTQTTPNAPPTVTTPQQADPSRVVATVVTSPREMMLYIVGGLAALFALLLAVTLAVHIRRRYIYVEVIAGGVVLVGVACGLLFLNGSDISAVGLPADGQSASVVMAL